MSEPGSGRDGQRKPVMIDLSAEDVGRVSAEPVAAGRHDESGAPGAAPDFDRDAAAAEAETTMAFAASEADAGAPDVDRLDRDHAYSGSPETPVSAADLGVGTEPAPPLGIAAAELAQPRRRLFAPLLLAAFLGGLVSAGAILALDRAGMLDLENPNGSGVADLSALRAEIADLRQAAAEPGPATDLAPLRQEVTDLSQAVQSLRNAPPGAAPDAQLLQGVENRLAALEAAPAATAAADPTLTSRLDALTADIRTLRDAPAPADTTGPALANLRSRLGALSGRADALEARPQVSLSGVERSVGELRDELAKLSARLETLPTGERVAALETQLAATGRQADLNAALGPAVAADALGAAVETGAPFTAELAALRTLGLDEASLAALEPHAAAGLPTLQELRAGFEAAIAPVDLTTPIPPGAGPVDRLLQSARSLVEVRPADPVAGSDPGAVVARVRASLDAGDLETAVAEWKTLPEAVRAETAEWEGRAEARRTADALVTRLRSEALSRLGARG